MDAASLALALVVWGVLPGLLLARVLDLGWTAVERITAAAGLSLALVSFSAYAAELVGLPVAPLPVLAVVGTICVALRLVQSKGPLRPARPAEPSYPFPPARPGWAPWLVCLLPLVVVTQLDVVSTVPLLPPSLHDGLDHANWFRLIYETRSLNPHEVMAPPLAADGSPIYYPWGMHGWLALVAQTTTMDPVGVLMRGLVFVSAVLPLSVYVFVAYLTGRGWPAMAAAALSLMFWWMPYQIWGWGGYPFLAGAVAALPFSRLALGAVERWQPAGLTAAGVCGLGLLLIHPSQALASLFIATAVSVTLAASRLVPWRTAWPSLAIVVLATVAFEAGPRAWEPLGAFVERAHAVAPAPESDRDRWPFGMYLNNDLQFPSAGRQAFAILHLAGAVVALWYRRTRPLFVLHLVFSLLIPLARHQTWATSLWYHSPERLWYEQYASLPALGALGLGALVGGGEWLMNRGRILRRWRLLVWPLVLWAFFGAFYQPFARRASQLLFLHAQRNPNLTVTDRRLLADFAWIRDHVPPGDVLFNAPADWGLPLPFTGRRTVFWSGGYALDRVAPWTLFLDGLRRGDPDASQAAAELDVLGIRYVYAAAINPALERGGRRPLDGQALERVAGLHAVYESPTAVILQTTGESGTLLGVRDSASVQFDSFHEPEEGRGREWRWTEGDGRMRIATAGLGSGDCFLRLYGPEPGSYYLRIDGEELELTERGYPLVSRHLAGDVLDLLVRVPEPVRTIRQFGGNTRTVGVRVTNVGVSCPAGHR